MTNKFQFSVPIHVEKEELEEAKKFIREFLRKTKGYSGNLSRMATKIAGECIDGWPHAPSSFKERILFKLNINDDGSARRTGGYADGDEAKKNLALVKRTGRNLAGRDAGDDAWIELQLLLTPAEREFYAKRLNDYKEDFELNESSDMPLVKQIIIEEIIQARSQSEVLKASRGESANSDIVKILSQSNDRLQKAQVLLGITGSQRKQEKTSGDGTIGQLAKKYSETLMEYSTLEDKWAGEELVVFLRKYIRGEMTERQFGILTFHTFGKALSIDDGKELYEEYIKDGILNRDKDSLDKDNFGRDIAELNNFGYDHILNHLELLNEEEKLLEDE